MQRRDLKYWFIAVLLGCLLICSLSSCGGTGGSGLSSLPAADQQGFRLNILPETYLGESPSGKFALEIEPGPATVEARVRVTDTNQLKACYFELIYDPGRFDPLEANSNKLLLGADHDPTALSPVESEAVDPSILELTIMSQSGAVHFGEIIADYQHKPGFTGSGVLATVTFARRQFTPRCASAPPTDDASRTEARWDSASRALTWFYYCTGDYDQNSEVGVTDLTPLGANFGAAGPFDSQSALSVIDGDNNGQLNVSDITPIGANFARRVQGYDVYVGPDPANLPGGNGEPATVDPIGFVPFGDHVGNAQGERLRFSFEYPEPDADQIIWVRPLDGDSAGTPSTPEQPAACNWQLRSVSAYATVNASLNYCSLAAIAGLPAVLYEDQDEQRLVFQRALDPTGQVWTSEVTVADSTNLHFASSLAEITGLPAVCHHDSTGVLYYIRALDANGATWGSPLLLAETGDSGWDCHLWLVDGNPAVCYQDLAAEALLYARATDPAGVDWEVPQVVANLGSTEAVAGAFSSPAIISGHPAIAFYHSGNAELRFVRGSDPLGSSWDSPVAVASGTDVGRYASLCEVDGAPAVSFLDDAGLAYIRAENETGTEWNAPAHVDSRFGPIQHLDTTLAILRGRPAISYYSGVESSDLMYVRALDPLGDFWGTPQVVDPLDQTGRSTRLLMVGDHPAISYLDETNSLVKYAFCLDESNFPPVARLDAFPARAEVDEEVTFDMSRSYDPNGMIEVIDWDMDGDGIFEDTFSPDPVRQLSFDQAGIHVVRVRVADGQGADAMAEARVIVGELGQPPQAALTADPADADISEAIHFDAADSFDPDGTIEKYEWDLAGDGDFETDTGLISNIDFEYSAAGSYSAAVKVTDNAGLSDIAFVCVNVGLLNQRPVAVLTGSPTFGNPPFTVSLNGSQSHDPDGSIVKYEWDLNDDGVFEIDGGSNALWQWLCELPGDQRVRLRVTDNDGAQGSTWMLCSSNQGPVAKIAAAPTSGDCPFTVTLDGSASFDSDGSIVAWGWDLFDDGHSEFAGTGAPTSEQFSMIWSGPVKVRLKVKDDMGAFGSAVVTIHGAHGWHVTTLDPVGWAGWLNSLADIKGTPAIAYYEYQSRSLKYIRSSNPLGVGGWQTPTNLGVIANPGVSAYSLDLALIDNSVPGIGFAGCINGNPTYAVAKNAEGTQWNPFVTVVPGGAGPGLGLCEVSGKPAIATHMLGVRFFPASNDLGTTWKSPVTVTKTLALYGDTCPLVIVNGNPALCYADSITQGGKSLGAVLYVRATEPDGSKWGAPVVVFDETEGGGGNLELAVIDGRPAVAFVASPSFFEVRYKRAVDQNGTAWTAPSILIQQGGREVLGLVTIDGKPAIGLTTCAAHDVMYFQANDAAGSSWPAGVVVDSSDNNIGWGSIQGDMISLNGHPAMSYCNSVHTSLKYAVLE